MNKSQETNKTLKEAEQAIVRYLRAHPDFFNRHLDLLETLRIPHPCRPAVSLIERQVLQLREQNTQLQKKFQELIEIARHNGRLVTRMHRLTLVLIETQHLDEMLQGIKSVLRDEFKADFSSLRLAIRAAPLDITEEELLSAEVEALFESILRTGRPCCGRLTHEQKTSLFNEAASHVASVALVPLRGMDWCGLLAIGSRDESRFHPGIGTLFLNCMGELISHALQPYLQEPNPCTSPPSPSFPKTETGE